LDIYRILNGICPIRGARCKVSDTHSLYLIPPGTVDALEARTSVYGQEHLAEYRGKNPLRFRDFLDLARREYGGTGSDELQWILTSNNVLEGSRNRPCEVQAQMIAELSARAFVHYKLPTLKEATAFAFLHKVATGADADFLQGDQTTYTRVQETIEVGRRLSVGGSTPDGLRVDYSRFPRNALGVLALREF
jgi:hypothetical protein